MATDGREYVGSGILRDAYGRRQMVAVPKHEVPDGTDLHQGAVGITDADGREEVVFDQVTTAVADVATAARKPLSAYKQYVTPDGNDTNDGLSWGKAKLTLAAAYTALADGGEIWMSRGTFDMTAQQIIGFTKSLRLKGRRDKTVLRLADGSTLSGGFLQATNGDRVILEDFTIDLNKANTTDPGSDTSGQGIYFAATNATGTVGGRIKGVRIINGWRSGIYIGNSATSNPSQVSVTDCEVTGCEKQAVFVTRPTDVKIVNNRFVGNCTAAGTGNSQIQVSAGDSTSGILIEGNTCSSATGGHGIAVAFGGNPIIRGNRCDGNGVTNAGGWGIVVSEDCVDPIVQGNRCRGNYSGGISFDPKTAASETVKATDGTISGNVCTHAVGPAGHGIYVQYSKGVSITGNNCHNNPGAGIRLVADTGCTVTGNTSHDNNKGIDCLDSVSGATGGRNTIVGNNVYANTVGASPSNFADTATVKSRFAQNDTDDSTTVASAATVTLPLNGDAFTVSGTTNITSITASWASRRVALIFSGILTLTDGSNLKLNANFVTSADDAIDLVCDGANWYATGPGSAN